MSLNWWGAPVCPGRPRGSGGPSTGHCCPDHMALGKEISLVWPKKEMQFLYFFVSFTLTHTQKIRYCACAFYSPFEKLHNEGRFIHFKMLSVHKAKPACILLVYNTALSSSLAKPAGVHFALILPSLGAGGGGQGGGSWCVQSVSYSMA